jgi:hypothetical protein
MAIINIPKGLESLRIPNVSEYAKRGLGRAATIYKERLGTPEGKHARKPTEAPRPDVGEIALKAGYARGLNEVSPDQRLNGSDVHVPELLNQHRKEEATANFVHSHEQLHGRLPLFGTPDAIEPQGPKARANNAAPQQKSKDN